MLILWLLLLYVAPTPAAAAGLGWRTPVAHASVAGRFTFDRAHPFAAGQRRGVDLRARPGTTVRAACGGRVTYAGPTPAGGRDVTVRCGALAATHLGLGSVTVRRGAVVVPGQPVGTVGRSGLVRLGARRLADRWGWVDPLPLLARRPPGGPLPLTPAPRAPRPVRPASTPDPAPLLRASPAPALTATTHAVDPRTLLVLAGVVLLAAGLPLHGALWRGRRGRTGSAPAPASARSGT